MNLVSNLARFFNAKVRKRGIHYFRGRRVTLTVCGPEKAQAIVTGSSPYAVLLTRDSRTLRASCTCPFSNRGEPCKHIWAALLAVEAKDGLQGSGGAPPGTLTVGAAEKELEDIARQAPSRPRPARPDPAARAAPRPPSWRALLDPLGEAEPPAPELASRLVYVIDVRTTLQRQQLTLEILTGRRKRDGSPGKLYWLHLNRGDVPRLPDPADRQILSLIAGAKQGGTWATWYSGANTPIPIPCEIPEAMAGVLIPLLCATGRCRLRLDPSSPTDEPVTWDGDEPWELWLDVCEEKGGNCTVTGSLRRGEERLALREPALLLASGFVMTADLR